VYGATGQVFVIFVMTVAAAEAAVGLAIIIAIFRHKQTVDLKNINLLRG
jgi:NADH-quinone oxidoreductase subunit K